MIQDAGSGSQVAEVWCRVGLTLTSAAARVEAVALGIDSRAGINSCYEVSGGDFCLGQNWDGVWAWSWSLISVG